MSWKGQRKRVHRMDSWWQNVHDMACQAFHVDVASYVFGQLKFSSFIHKLYRWEFKKITICLSVKDGLQGKVLCFGNENFQRDDLTLLTKMCRVTGPKYQCKKPLESHSFGIHQSITSKVPVDRCFSHRYDLKLNPSQPPVGQLCTLVKPMSYSNFLMTWT